MINMDKNAITSQLSQNAEEKTVLSHILDLAERSRMRETVESGNFMSDSLKMRAEELLRRTGYTDCFFWGGYNDAERTCPVFFTDYCDESVIVTDPSLAEIVFIFAELDRFNKGAELSHRDVLGSLMGLGIERDAVGDISADGNGAVFALKEPIAPFVLENLTKISRYPVKPTLSTHLRPSNKNDFEECFDTVASLRLDAVTAALFNTSRSIASEAISSGVLSVNGVTAKKADADVREGDKIAWRGHGRAMLEKTDGVSKKGRIRLLYKKWK